LKNNPPSGLAFGWRILGPVLLVVSSLAMVVGCLSEKRKTAAAPDEPDALELDSLSFSMEEVIDASAATSLQKQHQLRAFRKRSYREVSDIWEAENMPEFAPDGDGISDFWDALEREPSTGSAPQLSAAQKKSRAMNLLGFAAQLKAQGNTLEALEAFMEVRSLLDQQDPVYQPTLLQIAELNEKHRKYAETERILQEYFELTHTSVAKLTTFLPEFELARLMADIQPESDYLASFAVRRFKDGVPMNALIQLGYDHALFRKGFVLAAASRLHALARQTPMMDSLQRTLKILEEQYAQELLLPTNQQRKKANLEQDIRQHERALALASDPFGKPVLQTTWRQVAAALKPGEAAIEYVYYKTALPVRSDKVEYAALVIHHGATSPTFTPLCEEAELSALLLTNADRKEQYVRHLYGLDDRGLTLPSGAPSKSLYEMVYKPLETQLRDVQTIYYAPAGLLNRINLGAMSVGNRQCLADRHQLHALRSTRYLVAPAEGFPANQTALLLGGIEFDGRQAPNGATNALSRGTTRRVWGALDYTDSEVDTLARLLTRAGISYTILKGENATETAVKQLGVTQPSPTLMHLATHGYFYDRKTRDTTLSEPVSPFETNEHPLLRSGLILAGANQYWFGGTPKDNGPNDGILTAYEISQLNLSGTELVVLSACESGLGDIEGLEGVVGLQRAFKVAGAKNLIMSLWKVPDRKTEILMAKLYTNWLEHKMPLPEALDKAQRDMRKLGFDVYDWGGFFLLQ